MGNDPELNGCDYLMLAFDQELRRRGFAGNSCQISLELGATISPQALTDKVNEMTRHYPVLGARPGGLVRTRWKAPGRLSTSPQVRLHRNEPPLCQRIFNEPLAVSRGELLRLDLIERDAGRMSLSFTWAHALMDAPGAEHFLAMLGHPGLPFPAAQLAKRRSQAPFKERVKLAWKYLHHLDAFCQAPPRALGMRHADAPAALRYHVEKLSSQDTERVRANAVRYCGLLGDAQYHAAVSTVELHALHERLHCPSPSYVVPIPVGLRLKGSIEPLFSNQVSMLMFQFLPAHLDSVAHAVDALKTQTGKAMRAGLLESGRILSELFRFLPLSLYVTVLKHGLRGEICSLFYGDTGPVHPKLTSFLGAPVDEFAHVAAVTPSPGLGVIFYYFRGGLRVTVLHSAQVLTEEEAADFGARLRERLLNP